MNTYLIYLLCVVVGVIIGVPVGYVQCAMVRNGQRREPKLKMKLAGGASPALMKVKKAIDKLEPAHPIKCLQCVQCGDMCPGTALERIKRGCI
jgi:ferredoxin